MKTLLQLNNKDAKQFFLQGKQYCTTDLPEYFSFNDVIRQAEKMLERNSIIQLIREVEKEKRPQQLEDVNYTFQSNKKEKYKWRKLEIVHPVLYVGLVNEITNDDSWEEIQNRAKLFSKEKRIKCCSIPLVNNRKRNVVNNWWNAFEQQSIAYSMDYNFMGKTDIENCYPSFYTHTIAWALHTKETAKKNRTYELLGNRIDKILQSMHNGQTNGIPQGSALMDFLAELIIGYSDMLLGEKLKYLGIEDYHILRYRDDYRIFANNISDVEEILKQLTIILSSLNLNLSAEKTSISDNIIVDSIKTDKLQNICTPIDKNLTLQKQLMNIFNFSLSFPNSGVVKRELSRLLKDVFRKLDNRPNSYNQLIAIVLEIMRRNPETCPICVAMLCEMFNFLDVAVIKNIVVKITRKMQKEPFSDYLELWLQRITIPVDSYYPYDCILCQKVYSNVFIWNSEWLNESLNEESIINNDIINDITLSFSDEEINDITLGYND